MAEWQNMDAKPEPPQPVVFLQVGLGVVLVMVLHLVAGMVMGLLFAGAQELRGELPRDVTEVLTMVAGGWFLGLGCTQLAYVLPVFGIAYVRWRPVAIGVLIGAALTVVLQTACYGVFCGIAGVG